MSNLSRSSRLRKYESVYREYVKKTTAKDKSPRPSRRKKKHVESKDSSNIKRDGKRKIKLNAYQQFVKEESKKNKYKTLPTKKRFSKIAEAWDRHKKKLNK